MDTADDGWWFIHFQDAGVYGRIVHLQPVTWRDGWPLMGRVKDSECGEPVLNYSKPPTIHRPLIAVPQTSDEFDSSELGPQWQWHANHSDNWYSLSARKNWLRLYPQFTAHENLTQWPSLLLQKFPARSFTVETLLEFVPQQAGEAAGLIVAGESYATLALERKDANNQIVLRINGVQKFAQENITGAVKLCVAIKDGGLCQFSLAACDNLVTIPSTFPAQKGKWIGAKVGIYSLKRLKDARSGHVDVDFFRFT